MKTRVDLETAEEVLRLKDTDTKIYSDYMKGYYKFVEGVLCYFNEVEEYWDVNVAFDNKANHYIFIEEPEKEATEADINKLCKFWDNDENDFSISILRSIDIASQTDRAFVDDFDGVWIHCRRLTPSEISELTGYFVEERKKDE